MSRDTPQPLQSLKHFLSILDLEPAALQALIDLTIKRKAEFRRGELRPMLQGKVLAMLFQKQSLRTRLGFEAAMAQLGGHAINLEDHQVGMAKREDPGDVARVISSMCDVIMARVYHHQLLIELARASSVPVINGLSDWSHPCQALADLVTIQEHFGDLAERKVAFVGDGHNVARSLLNGCVKLGMSFALASPDGYQLEDAVIESAGGVAARVAQAVTVTQDPVEAVTDADVVYTDVWTSMGQEAEREERERAFKAFQVNARLMRHARPTGVVMHCLPACRNQEITDEVMDGPQSLIFPQAENRLHSQRALLEVLLTR
jgi:ornithine carbamoyltransferase